MQPIFSKSQSFHMDRGRLVCNECGGYFCNLVLFENHSHQDTDLRSTVPPIRSGPKSTHITFNNYTSSDMLEAFHKMPELDGCWLDKGMYYCCQCGKGFANPYTLFSHKILHPIGKVLTTKSVPGVMTQTEKPPVPSYDGKRTYIFSKTDDSASDDEVSEAHAVKKVHYDLTIDNLDQRWRRKILHIPEAEHNRAMEAGTSSGFEMKYGPHNPKYSPQNAKYELIDELDDEGDDPHGEKKASKQKGMPSVVIGDGQHNEWRTYVTRHGHSLDAPQRALGKNANVDVVRVGMDRKVIGQDGGPGGTDPGVKTGLLFTDLDADGMLKVFRKLPGMGNCTVVADGRFKCDQCFLAFTNPYLLFTHRFIHVLPKLTKEDRQQPLDARLLLYNMPGLEGCKVDGGKYHCDSCTENFDNPYLLFTHKMKHDDGPDSPAASVESPAAKPDSSSQDSTFEFNNHLEKCKIYNKRYVCDECNNVYPNPYLLLEHKLLHKDTHTAEVGNASKGTIDVGCYDCNICQVKFNSMDGLVTHNLMEGHVKVENSPANSEDEDTTSARVYHGQTTDHNLMEGHVKVENSPVKSEDEDTTSAGVYHGQTTDHNLVEGHVKVENSPVNSEDENTTSGGVYHGQTTAQTINVTTPASQGETTPPVSSSNAVQLVAVKVEDVTNIVSNNEIHDIEDPSSRPREIDDQQCVPLKHAVIKLHRLDMEPSDVVKIESRDQCIQ